MVNGEMAASALLQTVHDAVQKGRAREPVSRPRWWRHAD
jgi:hypothetical protein